MTLYVTTLPVGVIPGDLARMFARYGRVAGVEIRSGHNGETGQSAGVIDMPDGGADAVRSMDGRTFWGRSIAVGESPPWAPA